MSLHELRPLAIFVQTAERGSLRKAAAQQGISPQAASQALDRLEQHLGVRLFHRTTRHLALTAEGRQLLDSVQPALLGLERALDGARQARDAIAGPLRIVGPRSAFRPVLWPVLDSFCQRHPDVQPDVQLDDRVGNWVLDQVDVGFRIGISPGEGVIARRLFALQLIICAAPSYLARHGVPADLAALAGHRCSAFRHPVTERPLPWHVQVDDAAVDLPVVAALCTNDEDLELQATLEGHVISLQSGVTAAAHIRAGRLVPLLTAHVADHLGLHLYYGSRTALPARVRAFIDHAVQQLAGRADYVLAPEELQAAEARGRQALGR